MMMGRFGAVALMWNWVSRILLAGLNLQLTHYLQFNYCCCSTSLAYVESRERRRTTRKDRRRIEWMMDWVHSMVAAAAAAADCGKEDMSN